MKGSLVDVNKRVIKEFQFIGSGFLSTDALKNGIYFIRVLENNKYKTQKIVVID